MNATSEYLPNQSESNNGNGGKQRIFTLTPAQDQLTFVILDTRRQAFEDRRLKHSEKYFFAHILDLSLNRNINERPGVVTISQSRLAQSLGVCLRTIFSWKQKLCDTGYVWMSKKFVPNMWPLDVYHIAAIDERRRDQKTTPEGMWGNGGTRGVQNSGLGARKPGQPGLHLPGSKSPPPSPEEKNAETPAIAAASRNSLRPPVANPCDGESQILATVSRKSLRRTVAADCDGESQQFATDSRSNLRRTAAADCAHREVSGKRIETLEDGGEGSPPPSEALKEEIKTEDQALADWQKSIKDSFPSRLEKLRTKLSGQREQAPSVETRRFLSRKIKMLDELLDGPMPPAVTHQAKPAAKASPAPTPPTSEEILVAGAEYCLSIGKPELITAEQKKALRATGRGK